MANYLSGMKRQGTIRTVVRRSGHHEEELKINQDGLQLTTKWKQSRHFLLANSEGFKLQDGNLVIITLSLW